MIRALAVGCLFLTASSAPALRDSSSAPVAQIHFETVDHLVLLPVRVNGSRALTFVLDSGAMHTCLDSVAAVALGLRPVAADSSRGAGRGSVSRQHLAPLEVSVAGVTFPVRDPWVFDLGHVGVRHHVDGLLGYDLFERYVVRIDPVARTLTLLEPAAFRSQGSGAPIPLEVDDGHLYVQMRLTLDGDVSEVHRMRVDTGSSDAASDNLVRRSRERRESEQGVGLGQPYVDYSGVFARVELGPYAIEHCWGPANDHPAVGMEILRRFTLTFDVPHRQLYLKPNQHLHDAVPAPPDPR